MAVPSRPLEILLVEDSPSDARLMMEALRQTSAISKLHLTSSGEEALSFLRRKGVFEGAVRPDIILLDLNLPGKDGRDVLAEIKADPELKSIPVAVLTTSQSEADVVKAYMLHANCYINKPLDLDEFTRVVGSFEEFWLRTATLPTSATAF
ncbi:MAG: response regulator [Bryobacteraceae bacterium]